MSEKIVLLTTLPDLFEADLLRGKLKSEGIECFIPDEHAISTNPLYTTALGNIRVEVKENDLNKA